MENSASLDLIAAVIAHSVWYVMLDALLISPNLIDFSCSHIYSKVSVTKEDKDRAMEYANVDIEAPASTVGKFGGKKYKKQKKIKRTKNVKKSKKTKKYTKRTRKNKLL